MLHSGSTTHTGQMMRSKHLRSGLTTHKRVPGVATTQDNFVLHVCNTMGSGCRAARKTRSNGMGLGSRTRPAQGPPLRAVELAHVELAAVDGRSPRWTVVTNCRGSAGGGVHKVS